MIIQKVQLKIKDQIPSRFLSQIGTEAKKTAIKTAAKTQNSIRPVARIAEQMTAQADTIRIEIKER